LLTTLYRNSSQFHQTEPVLVVCSVHMSAVTVSRYIASFPYLNACGVFSNQLTTLSSIL